MGGFFTTHDENGNRVLDASGMDRRSFCGLLATCGVVFVVQSTFGSLTAYAADGTAVGEITNSPYSADETNLGIASANSDGMLLGAFFVTEGSEDTYHDVLCTSDNGKVFEQIGIPYTSSLNPFSDPSIFHYNDGFWMVAN